MSIDCTSCGHAIPLGQFRCGKCGAVQSRDSIDDMSDVGELAMDDPLPLLGKARDGSQPVAYDGSSENERAPESLRESSNEPSGRESIVPRGTFASDEPAPPDEEPVAANTEGERSDPALPKADVADAETEAVLPPAGPRAITPAQPVLDPHLPQSAALPPRQPAARPPFLASEILHEDLMPLEPGRHALTQTLRACGAIGLFIAVWGYGSAPFALASIGSLGLLVTSALRVPHITRAAMVATISGAGLSVACFWRMKSGGAFEDALLAVSTTLLASALLFRAWYRSSNAARGLVAAGLITSLGWAGMGIDKRLLLLDWTWQSWLPALTLAVFVILCVLSLLAFMDDETTGACDIWAVCLLFWYAVHALAREALIAEGTGIDEGMSTLGLTEPVFAAPMAVALAQLLARSLGQQHRTTQVLLRRNA